VQRPCPGGKACRNPSDFVRGTKRQEKKALLQRKRIRKARQEVQEKIPRPTGCLDKKVAGKGRGEKPMGGARTERRGTGRAQSCPLEVVKKRLDKENVRFGARKEVGKNPVVGQGREGNCCRRHWTTRRLKSQIPGNHARSVGKPRDRRKRTR